MTQHSRSGSQYEPTFLDDLRGQIADCEITIVGLRHRAEAVGMSSDDRQIIQAWIDQLSCCRDTFTTFLNLCIERNSTEEVQDGQA